MNPKLQKLGLGKTISAIAFILKERSPPSSTVDSGCKKNGSKPVTPLHEFVNHPVALDLIHNGATCQLLKQKMGQSIQQSGEIKFSDLGPLKAEEHQDLNCDVKEYMLLAGYRLTRLEYHNFVKRDDSF